MIVETPLALSYILPADVFFLATDRQALAANAPVLTEGEADVAVAEPSVSYKAAEPTVAESIAPKIIVAEPVASIPMTPKVEIKTESIVESPPIAPPVAAITPAQPNFNSLGGFAQKFLVIVNYPDQDVMEPGHLKALESTITRKEMGMNDVAIFNIGKYPGTDLKAVARAFKPKRMLLLGRDSFPIGLAEQPLNQLTLLGTCQLLYSDNFTDMMGNKEKTKAFWGQMQLL